MLESLFNLIHKDSRNNLFSMLPMPKVLEWMFKLSSLSAEKKRNFKSKKLSKLLETRLLIDSGSSHSMITRKPVNGDIYQLKLTVNTLKGLLLNSKTVATKPMLLHQYKLGMIHSRADWAALRLITLNFGTFLAMPKKIGNLTSIHINKLEVGKPHIWNSTLKRNYVGLQFW